MAAALIVIVVEFATLGKRPVHEDGVVHRHLIAIFYNAGRAAALRVFDKSIDRLIPRHAGADQLATQLIQQQFPAARHGFRADMRIVQLANKIGKFLRCGLTWTPRRTHSLPASLNSGANPGSFLPFRCKPACRRLIRAISHSSVSFQTDRHGPGRSLSITSLIIGRWKYARHSIITQTA